VWVEVAYTPAEQERGLMFRKGLAENHGMLFMFEQENAYGFWMKNMRFPIDIIWVDRDKKIIDIYQYALPCKEICKTMVPKSAAKFVLEVSAGFAQRHRIRLGDSLEFDLKR
jgi:uncharacterized protein